MRILENIPKAQKRAAGAETEQRNADDHKRQMIPLPDGEYTRKQHLEGQGGEGDEEDGE